MANGGQRSRGPLTGALLLIAVGAIFMYANLRPDWNPWPVISRYWPVLLIVLGLGKLVDAMVANRSGAIRGAPGAVPAPRHRGEIFAILLVVFLLAFAAAGSRRFSRVAHRTETVDALGARFVRVNIEMPSGQLTVSGGATKLLEGDFEYSEADREPNISYDHSGTEGNLSISQPGHTPLNHVIGRGNADNWTVRLNNDEARELRLDMGAGQGDFNLKGVHLNKLTVDIGAGEINADLTGDWKENVDVRIEGGVGSATVRLPHNVGVRVRAEGGIGRIDVSGLHKHEGYYINDAYGSSPVTMNVSVEGGVGEIRLISE